MTFATQTRCHARGFSLLEMLTTIAVLGMLTSIALMSLGNINQHSLDTRNRRNAQELAGTCAAAQAAGLDFVVNGDLARTIENIVSGGTVSDGAFAGRNFSVPGLQREDQASAKTYLTLDNGTLSYRSRP